jgi:hypothetical protein
LRYSIFKGKENPTIRENHDYHKTLRVAAEHGVNKTWSANQRITYLKGEIEFNQRLISSGRINFRSIKTAKIWNDEMEKEICYLTKKKVIILEKPNELMRLTEEEIKIANRHPIEHLIDFKNGKATAWCHEDKHPSLTLWRHGNRAKCWSCDKGFSPIDVLMSRDNMGFIEAVRLLQ